MDGNRANEVLQFWQSAGAAAWWRKNSKFDKQIEERFGALHTEAANRQLDIWRGEANSCLALIIVLDQFSRNLFRGEAKAFAQDDYGLELARHGVKNGFDHAVDKEISGFFYLPFMHSENLEDQEACVELIRAANVEGSLKSAIEHRDIIAQFGRFPHRNAIFERDTSSEEQEFLDSGGFAG